MLSASIPVSSRLNHQRTVITVNAGATEERAEKARGRIKETRERVAVAAGAKSCSLSQPHPQLSHIHTHNTTTHIRTNTHTYMPICCNILLLKSLCRIKRQHPDLYSKLFTFLVRSSSNLFLISLCKPIPVFLSFFPPSLHPLLFSHSEF